MNEIKVISQQMIKDKEFDYQLDGFKLSAWFLKNNEKTLSFLEGSIYLYIQEGHVNFEDKNSIYKLGAGNYVSRKCPITINLSQNSFVIIIQTPAKYKTLNHAGGPIEELGRLNYIDGCSDTLLIPPTILGEPCLNFLHFPKNTCQTMHSHPSFRFGLITRGKGVSISENSELSLNTGDVFLIPSAYLHKFDTHESIMDAIAFHPDSDWGPTDEVHPMINRTWVDGKKI
jgi:hypothetical protein